MSALAEVLQARGASVRGSDVADHFYTEEVLGSLRIPFVNGFSAANIAGTEDLVVYSAAYDPSSHEELVEAAGRGIPLLSYPEALGLLSKEAVSTGIAGVHGKTTTTAMTGTIVKALGLPVTVIAGSAARDFGDRSTLLLGGTYLVAEPCEYRRHCRSFHPSSLVITSVEPDHLDYFRDYDDILSAFVAYGRSLPPGGVLIYCADDIGACQAAEGIAEGRGDLTLTPYGEKASGAFRIQEISAGTGETRFRLQGMRVPFSLHVPGSHNVKNAAAAAAAAGRILEQERGVCTEADEKVISRALADFRGTRRRSEIVGEAGGILFMDDYGHHPTAMETTLKGLKDFYGNRRIVVDFMSHTYSRTKKLLPDFASSLTYADAVVLHKIYASAREKDSGRVTGRDLYKAVRDLREEVYYFEEVMDALPFLQGFLQAGDLFITMGAGDNWKLCHALYSAFGGQS